MSTTLEPELIPILTQAEAETILQPLFDELRHCIQLGWQAWEELGSKEPELRMPLSARTRASFVYDHIAHLAKSHFADNPAVRVSERRGFLTLIIDDKVVVRFKKLGKNLHAASIRTLQERQYSGQQMTFGWDDNATRVVAGYRLNVLQTAIQDIYITCPRGERLEWWFVVPERAVGTFIVSPAEFNPSGQKTPKVRPRKLKDNKVQER